ncbi:F-box/kelch-repeat protein At3g17530-like [Pyrus x bretschneideri]|uniref:F-box/kelch-repeat protein At3g17530-like n=1 Tax=Pyrus x bretschneideri TaxID=225117 RepID=UPI00202EB4D8|nr:F-box/kelch-repeat protein At3g17530-like [Pyrus x bretschneideri]XP_018506072.2 F-box/kelch-repeat protein At3g17530-like [Pyrus x bretschneideri]XP_048430215.1 F-box/kelch-repeat protein At3g17530-like [Pyrus x bretschneideri]
MTNKTSKIGQYLLVNILSTLPPKSLMRFKCVAKWWHALINDPRFVDKHLSHSLLDDQSTRVLLKRMLFPSTEDPNRDKFQSVFSVLTFDNVIVDDDDGGVHKCSTLSGIEDFDVPLAMSLEIGDDQSFHVAGHCNGIICLARPNSTKMLLWNPAIQEFRVLPSEIYIPDWFDEASLRDPHPWWLGMPYMPRADRFDDVLGLGYDPKSKDYKVVKIGFSCSELHGGTKHLIIHPPKVVVYTLGTSSWREIEPYSLETETTFLWPETFQVYFKGMCYWIGSEQQKEFAHSYDATYPEEEKIRRVIVLLDMSREVFHDILLPHEMVEFNDFEGIGIEMRLKVWNESIALFRLNHNTFEDGDTPSFEMWLMDDDSGGGAKNEGGVWTKHIAYRISSFSESRLPLHYTLAMGKSDEVLTVEENGGIVCYNFRTKKLKNLPIQTAVRITPRFPPQSYYFPLCKENHSPVVYVKSMVSVMEGNKYMST